MKQKHLNIIGGILLCVITFIALLVEIVNPHSFLLIKGATIRACLLTALLAAYIAHHIIKKKKLSTVIIANLAIAGLAYTLSALTMHE